MINEALSLNFEELFESFQKLEPIHVLDSSEIKKISPQKTKHKTSLELTGARVGSSIVPEDNNNNNKFSKA